MIRIRRRGERCFETRSSNPPNDSTRFPRYATFFLVNQTPYNVHGPSSKTVPERLSGAHVGGYVTRTRAAFRFLRRPEERSANPFDAKVDETTRANNTRDPEARPFTRDGNNE